MIAPHNKPYGYYAQQLNENMYILNLFCTQCPIYDANLLSFDFQFLVSSPLVVKYQIDQSRLDCYSIRKKYKIFFINNLKFELLFFFEKNKRNKRN